MTILGELNPPNGLPGDFPEEELFLDRRSVTITHLQYEIVGLKGRRPTKRSRQLFQHEQQWTTVF